MTAHLPRDRSISVLEVGPGIGPITRVLLERLAPGSRVHAVELSPSFCAILRAQMPELRPDVSFEVFEGPLQAFPGQAAFDYVVSSLPHNNFDERLLSEILSAYERLAKPGAGFAYYEYLGVGTYRRCFRPGIEHAMAQLASKMSSSSLVWLNPPPAIVRSGRL